jgi:hypothetical protein
LSHSSSISRFSAMTCFSLSRSAAAFSNSCASMAASFSARTRRRRSSTSLTPGGAVIILMRILRAGLVDEVDRLVGQEAVGDVAVGQRGGRLDGAIGDRDTVVRLVAVAQTARISTVSATLGSPTMIGWKRRSSAGSFSTYLRYSSRVVAPMVCSSPRASAGLMMLAASMAPSAAPAPTSVCISSTNRMTSPRSRISFMSFLRRSSNSPRYFEPATRAARSSV